MAATETRGTVVGVHDERRHHEGKREGEMVVQNPPSTAAAAMPHGFPATHSKILLFTMSLEVGDGGVPMAQLESIHPSRRFAAAPEIGNGSQRKVVGVAPTTVMKLLWMAAEGRIRRRRRPEGRWQRHITRQGCGLQPATVLWSMEAFH
ncbi:unnamed protein product [Lactuca virosa]|uniref:Uncharacterized protein n=1 Tax=Lactuca virosa TaxID=75947 RepID=A0AAU9PT56_9ASTR|nr:unnamed protein product [Lactuca virosa]